MTLTMICILIGLLNLGFNIYNSIQAKKQHAENQLILKYIAAAAKIRVLSRGSR